MKKEFLGVDGLAARWEVSAYTARRRIREMPYLRIGGLLRVALSDVERYEASRTRRPGRQVAAGR